MLDQGVRLRHVPWTCQWGHFGDSGGPCAPRLASQASPEQRQSPWLCLHPNVLPEGAVLFKGDCEQCPLWAATQPKPPARWDRPLFSKPRRMAMLSLVLSTFAATMFAMQAAATPPAQAPKDTKTIITLSGCVGRDIAKPGSFTFAETDTATKYRLGGVSVRKYVGQRVEIVGAPVGRRPTIRGGLLPSPNVAAQAGALDPAQVAIASQPGHDQWHGHSRVAGVSRDAGAIARVMPIVVSGSGQQGLFSRGRGTNPSPDSGQLIPEGPLDLPERSPLGFCSQIGREHLAEVCLA